MPRGPDERDAQERLADLLDQWCVQASTVVLSDLAVAGNVQALPSIAVDGFAVVTG